MQKIQLAVEGMTCQACAARIEKVLKRQDGVQEAAVNFAAETAQVVFDEKRIDGAGVIAAIGKAGFQAAPPKDLLERQEEKVLPSLQLWLTWLCALPFVPGMIGMLIGQHGWMPGPVWQFVLASVVQCGLAWRFYRGAWASLRGGAANMDVLVSLGTVSIWLYSTVMFLSGSHGHLYFEASVMVIAFVSFGKYLEQRVKKQSLNSISLMLKLTPAEVEVERGGQWQRVPLNQVQTGDTVRARQGGRIAADGEVLSGEAWCDESHLTGEPRALKKTAGDKVLAGSLVDNGSIVFQAAALGQETLLGDMVSALADAQGSKAPIARLADKVAAVFVPVVVGIALLTFVLTYVFSGSLNTALTHAVAVLVIACPCALGLATPAAVMVGMGQAARHGIWFKDAAALERAGKIDTVLLDKTGTLTQGRPQIVHSWTDCANTLDENTILQYAAGAENQVSHPLADAVVQAAVARGLVLADVGQIHVEAGQGVRGSTAHGEIFIGTPPFCALTLPEEWAEQWADSSIVAVRLGENAAAFAVADALKEDSLEGVRSLQKQGIDVRIVSGDRQSAADKTAADLGIVHVHGNVTPRGKADLVKELQAAGKVVAMVGDGVNDAAALAAADVGFAMKNGTQIAEHSADVTLMRHSVAQLAQAVAVSRATLGNIRQNLFFAFFYNILGIPLAAAGFLNPVLAGAAMALSSVSVLGNALRLKRRKF